MLSQALFEQLLVDADGIVLAVRLQPGPRLVIGSTFALAYQSRDD
jgi:hypothetical protein